MDLTKFYPENLSKLDASEVIEFQNLTASQIKELAQQDKGFSTYLVYKRPSNLGNQLETRGNYTVVSDYLSKGHTVHLVTPSHLYNPQTAQPQKKVVEFVEASEPLSLEDFAKLKESKEVEVEVETEEVVEQESKEVEAPIEPKKTKSKKSK